MKFFLLLCLAWSAACDKLTRPAYLPPDAAAAWGAGAGLQAPRAGPARTAQSTAAQAHILSYENDINEEGYHYAYETSDGTKAEQTGHVIAGAGEAGSLRVSGSYSYVGPDGRTYAVAYTADERGFLARGTHLPAPPPPAPAPTAPTALPAARSLKLAEGSGAHYDSKRSSYDADAGY